MIHIYEYFTGLNMAKSAKHIQARKMRGDGMSIKDIANKLGVSKGSASIWCRGILLTEQQMQKLHRKMVRGGYIGRMKGARMQADRKQQRIQEYYKQAKIDFYDLDQRELLILGIGLYWGEGAKSNGARFSNSDPYIIKIIMKWFRECLHISEDRFLMYVGINEIHKKRADEVIRYWASVANVPVEQFRKPVFIHAKNKKIYENHDTHYGTLTIRISKGYSLLYQILGWMKVLGEKTE